MDLTKEGSAEEKDYEMSQIIQAIRLVEEAQELVDGVMCEGYENHYRAYGRYGFDTLLGNGNEYDSSLFSILKELEERNDV